MGQISGIAFILGLDAAKAPDTGSMTLPLLVLMALMAFCLVLTARLTEAPRIPEGPH